MIRMVQRADLFYACKRIDLQKRPATTPLVIGQSPARPIFRTAAIRGKPFIIRYNLFIFNHYFIRKLYA